MQKLLRILIPLVIFAIGYFAMKKLGKKEAPPVFDQPKAEKIKTEANPLVRENFPIILKTQGTIRASNQTTVTAQVAGKIVKIHPSFEDGAFFTQGEVLLELDAVDFETNVASAEARVARAEASLLQEKARSKQARLNWEEIGYDEPPSDLVLRKPQLKEAEANVKAAMSDLKLAERNLERTKVRAPYSGRVRERTVGLGQVIGGSTPLGRIFSTQAAEIRLPLSSYQLGFIDLNSKTNDENLEITLFDALNNESSISRKATLLRTEGTLDERSRELFVIARIDDPFSISTDLPAFRIGQPVRAEIPGKIMEDVFAIPRRVLRNVNELVIIDKDTKKISHKRIEGIWSNDEVILTKQNLPEGSFYPTSQMPYAPKDAEVEIIEPAREEVAPNTTEKEKTTPEA